LQHSHFNNIVDPRPVAFNESRVSGTGFPPWLMQACQVHIIDMDLSRAAESQRVAVDADAETFSNILVSGCPGGAWTALLRRDWRRRR
jgi:hypothetical protein